MLEMGFEKELNAILAAMPSSNLRPLDEEFVEDESDRMYRQTIMFSATMYASGEGTQRGVRGTARVLVWGYVVSRTIIAGY